MPGTRAIHVATRTRAAARRVYAFAIVTLTPLAAACAGGDAATETGWRAAVDTIGDTIAVRTVSGMVWPDTARLVEEIRIGSMDGADAYVFGEPSALALGPAGEIVVLDAQVPVVRVYGPDGVHRVDLGRKGGGPGEYERPDGIAVLQDGRVAVRDPGNGRIVLFSLDGETAGGFPHPTGGGFNTSSPLWVDRDGVAWVTTLKHFGRPPWEWEFILIGVTPDGEVTDTIEAPRFEYDRRMVTASRENSSSQRTVPFTSQAVWAFSPLGYFVGGVTGEYRVDLLRVDRPVLSIRREAHEPVPVLPEEAAERRTRITEGLQRGYPGWRWNGPGIPDTKPPLRDVFADADGRIWVVVSRPGRETMTAAEAREEARRTGRTPLRFQEPPAFDVFDSEGRFLGPVAAPPDLQLDPAPLARGDSVWAVARDELGVPSVVRYRLVR
jgi:hypothetical protein